MVGIVCVGGLLCVVAYVFNAPVGTLIATSGVLAVIVGLALQRTLGDVFSGIALNLGRPYGIGDRIAFGDGIEGLVVETNWRVTHLLNGANDLVIVPNSDLAKVAVRLSPTSSPAPMASAMQTVPMNSDTILFAPAPTVPIKAMDALAIELELWFRVADVTAVGAAQNEIFDLVFRHAKANNLALAPSVNVHLAGVGAEAAEVNDRRPTPLRLVDALPLFSSLTMAEKQALAETMTRRSYRTNDILAQQGATLHALMIMRKGVASMTRREADREVELGRFAPGDCVGERGLLAGTGEAGTIRALTAVVVYEIGHDGFQPLMRERPAIAEELATILSRRVEQERHLFEPGSEAVPVGSMPRLVARTRQLFGVT